MEGRPGEPTSHAFFSTPFGECALAWGARGLRWILLPERSPEETRARVARIASTSVEEESPPPWVKEAMHRIARHLQTGAEDLSTILLDMEPVSPFFRRVYEVTCGVRPGEVKTYSEIASLVGSPSAVRAVGQALGKNPFPVVVPCHRVVAAGGKPGGFSAPGGLDTKARLLAIEGRVLAGAEQTTFDFGFRP
ncbi:MAG: methylated-DNA--[protein]-cysteine S-methyltransferase [Minicystis sp.]